MKLFGKGGDSCPENPDCDPRNCGQEFCAWRDKEWAIENLRRIAYLSPEELEELYMKKVGKKGGNQRNQKDRN